jgi:predicted ester cyclase
MNNKQVVSDFIATLNQRRLVDLPRYLATDVIDHNKIIHGEPDEPGAAFDGFRQQLVAFEGEMVPEELIAEDDRVVLRLTVNARHTGAHPRMPSPTNRFCSVEQIWILTLAASRITEIRAVSDRLGMFMQLGWDWPTE